MKKLLLLSLLTAASIAQAGAQIRTTEYLDDSHLSRWVVDVNLLGGLSNQDFTLPNSKVNYLNALNANTGNLTFDKGYAYGADAQVGFFFGKKRHFGIGIGYLYMMQQGDATLNNFQIEYQATDFKGSTYRQVVTGHDMKENLMITNVNIPLMLKYKNRFSKRWGIAVDAGAIYNIQMQNAYTTHASFDYEAIYQFGIAGDGTKVPIYDNSAVPSANDWLITKAEFLRNNPNGNIQDYFNAKRALGYNVGLNQVVSNTKGTVSYPQGNIGFMIQPSFNFFLSDHVALNFGGYYMFQPFRNGTNTAYHITDGVGSYSSVLNNVSKVDNQSYGVNIGARFFFGKKRASLAITSVDQMSPSACGRYDGSISLNGLRPNKPVTVDYTLNGVKQNQFSSTVQNDGQVKITNLGAGEYGSIVATIKKENVTSASLTLTDPPMVSPFRYTANPTISGACNGFVIFKGMPAGSSATISYNLNGSAHAAYTGIVDSDKLLTVNGLCEGSYTGIVATINKCSANCPDFVLVSPTEQPTNIKETTKRTVVTQTTVENNITISTISGIDISTPMLFDVNEYILHKDAFPVIEEAYNELKHNKGSMLIIEGNADSTGLEAKNRPLSLNRANSVKHELTKRGIRASRIRTIGHGSQDPVATNRTYAGKQENRNAVMTITPAKNNPLNMPLLGEK